MPAPYLVLAVGGTGESWPGDTRTDVAGMLRYITRELDYRFESRWVGYDSAYGMLPALVGVSYASSVHRGVTALLAAIRADDRPVVLIGYSQGAAVSTTLLQLLAQGHWPDVVERIVGTVHLANPLRQPGICLNGGVPGYGIALRYIDGVSPIAGAYNIVPVAEIAHPDDVIASADPDSMLRSLAVVTEFMSFTDLATWGTSLVAAAKAVDWRAQAQTWRDVAYQAGRFRRAGIEAGGYLTGRHTSYNVERVAGTGPTYTKLAAMWISATVEDWEEQGAYVDEDAA